MTSPAREAALERLIEAVRKRIVPQHNDTCSYVLTDSRMYECDCGHDELEAAIDVYDRLPAADDGWRPIETAPKEEGVWVLACVAGGKIPGILGWDEDEGHFWLNGMFREEPKPTHWMPYVPPPPRPEKPDAEGGER